MVRLLAITITSLSLTLFSVASVVYKTKQFYPATIYLTKNRICLTTLVFQCIVFYVLLIKLLCRVFFGVLQRTEIDTILSRYWFVFVDVCLVLASYQDQLSLSFLVPFGILIFAKGFHWLIDERVEYMERTPVITKTFHIRCISLLFLLGYIDIYNIRNNAWRTAYIGESLHLTIGIEYMTMFMTLIHTYIRYALHTIDSRRSTPWDQKNMYFMILDIIFGLLKFLHYIDAIYAIWHFEQFPLFLVRPLYLSVRFLKKSLKDYIMSRRAINFMNTVFKDGTSEDLQSISDPTCIICREEMTLDETQTSNHGVVKKLPCNHLFHSGCLRNWFQRQQTCPICRMDVISQANRNRTANNNHTRNIEQNPDNSQPSNSNNQPTANSQSQFSSSSQSQATLPSSASNSNNIPSGSRPFIQTSQIPGSSPSTPSSFGINQFPSFIQPIPGTMFPIIMPNFPQLSSNVPKMTQSDLDSSFLDEECLRTSVEARMAALRQVQILLDAAMLQMNAYVSATAAYSSSNTNTANPPNSNTNESKCERNDSDASKSEIPSSIKEESPDDKINSEIRNRRCQKFNNPPSTPN